MNRFPEHRRPSGSREPSLRLRERELQQQRALQHREIVVRDQRQHERRRRPRDAPTCLPCCRSGSPCRPRSAPGRRPSRPASRRRAGRGGCACRRPRNVEKLRSSSSRSPPGVTRAIAHVEVVDALDREFARARSADQEAADVARLVEPALRDRDQGAGERALRHECEALDALVVRQPGEGRRHRDRRSARQQAAACRSRSARCDARARFRRRPCRRPRRAPRCRTSGAPRAACRRGRGSAPSRHPQCRPDVPPRRRCARAASAPCR